MSVSIDLSGKIALVTGSSQGIGASVAGRLHKAGATVVLNHPGIESTKLDAETLLADLNRQRLESAVVLEADVADASSVQNMMARIHETFGGLDLLVNNAGVLRDRSISKMTLDEWRAVIDVNLSGVFHCCKYGLEIIREGGSIVNMGSLAATAGFHGQANYASAKAGVHALTRVLSREAARRSIRVNAVAPGIVETNMAAQIRPEVRASMLTQIPLGRFAQPFEIADAVLFLCSPLSSYVTGHILEINGGWRG